MKRFLLLLALLAAPPALAQTPVCFAQSDGSCSRGNLTPSGGNPCYNPGASVQSLFGSTSGTTAVQLIALSGTTKIYVCSLTVVGVSGTTPTFSLVYGTGSNCGTGQNVFLGAWQTAANTVYPFSYPLGITPAGQALCYLGSGTLPVQRYTLTYVQQ